MVGKLNTNLWNLRLLWMRALWQLLVWNALRVLRLWCSSLFMSLRSINLMSMLNRLLCFSNRWLCLSRLGSWIRVIYREARFRLFLWPDLWLDICPADLWLLDNNVDIHKKFHLYFHFYVLIKTKIVIKRLFFIHRTHRIVGYRHRTWSRNVHRNKK